MSLPVRAVFFDVDFTLIYPGPTFQAEGYERFCRRRGIDIDPALFPHAVAAASALLSVEQDHVYDAAIFVRYTRRIIEAMGGAASGAELDAVARDIYDEWAVCQHFFLYPDVAPVLHALARSGLTLGLISNAHRCLTSFQEHFELASLISVAVSSSENGFMKPHPSIFEAALALAGVRAEESVMVGDSLAHDIEGAKRIGMRGVLVDRSDDPATSEGDVSVIRTFADLPGLLGAL